MRITDDHDVTPCPCPYCGKLNDGAAGGDKAPVEGDVGVCMYCTNIMVYDAKGLLRLPTAAERKRFEKDPEVIEVQNTIFLLKIQGVFDTKGYS